MSPLPRAALAALLMWGCLCGPDGASNMTPESSVASAYLSGQPSALSSEDRLFLDAADGRLLEGVLRPAPEASDAAGIVALLLDGRPTGLQVQDARFVPWEPSKILAIDPEGRLVLRPLAPGGPEVVLSEGAQPGFDLSTACRCALFVRGEADQGALMRVDLDDRKVTTLAEDVSPVWLPALSPDGSSVAFVSGRDGEAALWRLRLSGGAPERWTAAGLPFPEGPDRILHTGGGLLFAQAGVVHHIDTAGRVTSRTGLAAPRWVSRPVTLSFGAGRPMGPAEAAAELTR